MNKKKKKNNIFINIILVICVCVLIYSGSKLFILMKGYHEGAATYKDVRKECTAVEAVKKDDKTKEEEFYVNFEKLLKRNSDAVGWIRFDEPQEINYPVVQGATNKEYLWTNFDSAYNRGGTLFVETDNNPDFRDRNTIIYGHNMWDKTMLSRLDKYSKKEFYEKYPYFYIYTPDGKKITYQVLSTGIVNDDSFLYRIDFENDEDFYSYLNDSKKESNYETDAEINVASHIVTLSTCLYGHDPKNEDKRYILQGIAVNEEKVNGGIDGYKAIRKKDR